MTSLPVRIIDSERPLHERGMRALTIALTIWSADAARARFLARGAAEMKIAKTSQVSLRFRPGYSEWMAAAPKAIDTTVPVSITVLSVTPMRAGRLFALAAVEVDIDGVPIEIHGIRALHLPPAATRIELPTGCRREMVRSGCSPGRSDGPDRRCRVGSPRRSLKAA
jgi:hypothetical protein